MFFDGEATAMRKPDFFIVGAPKCATTSLYWYLGAHPEIFLPHDPRWKESPDVGRNEVSPVALSKAALWKEPSFFGRDQWVADRRCIRDESEYLKLFSAATTEKRVGEATTSYLYSQTAAEEIKAFNPAADIIISLRNPVEVMYSMHRQNLVGHNEDILDFEDALDAEEDRKQGRRIPKRAPKPVQLLYREIVQFSKHVERFYRTFGREKVLVLLFEDIRDEPSRTYASILAFLGVDDTFTLPTFSNENQSAPLKNLAIRRFIYQHPRFARAMRKLVPLPLVQYTSRLVSPIATPTRPLLSPEVRDRLQKQLRPEVEKLSELLDRDLTHWCRD